MIDVYTPIYTDKRKMRTIITFKNLSPLNSSSLTSHRSVTDVAVNTDEHSYCWSGTITLHSWVFKLHISRSLAMSITSQSYRLLKTTLLLVKAQIWVLFSMTPVMSLFIFDACYGWIVLLTRALVGQSRLVIQQAGIWTQFYTNYPPHQMLPWKKSYKAFVKHMS